MFGRIAIVACLVLPAPGLSGNLLRPAPDLIASQIADATTCATATNQVNNVLNELADKLTKYSDCIADSQGGDDCASEFESLQSDQEDFEAAAIQYRAACN